MDSNKVKAWVRTYDPLRDKSLGNICLPFLHWKLIQCLYHPLYQHYFYWYPQFLSACVCVRQSVTLKRLTSKLNGCHVMVSLAYIHVLWEYWNKKHSAFSVNVLLYQNLPKLSAALLASNSSKTNRHVI